MQHIVASGIIIRVAPRSIKRGISVQEVLSIGLKHHRLPEGVKVPVTYSLAEKARAYWSSHQLECRGIPEKNAKFARVAVKDRLALQLKADKAPFIQ